METDYIEALYDIANRACEVWSADARVVGVCLIGSLARNEADRCSDIDLYICVESGTIKSIIAEAPTRASEVGEVLLGDYGFNEQAYVALYKTSLGIVKVDYDFLAIDDLPQLVSKSFASHTHLFHSRILFDRRGRLASALSPETMKEKDDDPRLSNRFFLAAWSVIRMVRRGELWEAFDILNTMRDPMLTRALCCATGVAFENYRRLETKFAPPLQSRLKATIGGPDAEDLLCALVAALDLYEHANVLLGRKLSNTAQATVVSIREEILVLFRELKPLHGQP